MIPKVGTVHSRQFWQDPNYPVFGPLDNEADNDTIVIHYTGADDLIDGDPGESADDLPQYHRNMQYSYVTRRGYSLGYSFSVDWLGGVWQIRGWEFQSAANRNHNGHTLPILVLVDGADRATDEAAKSIRQIIRAAEARSGRIMRVVGHGQLDGAATSCPGAGLLFDIAAGVFDVRKHNDDVVAPPPVVPPPPPDQGDSEDMLINFVQYKGSGFGQPQPAVYAQYSGGYKVWVPNQDVLNVLKSVSGISEVAQMDDTWFVAAGPVVGALPHDGQVDEWGRRVWA